MRKIIFATGNAHKMVEIREILADLPFEILSMKEAGICLDIEENGATFEENSKIKAMALAEYISSNREKFPELEGCLVMADDSGLEIDAMDGGPGILSARFMGENTPHSEKCKEILRRLSGLAGEARAADFRCVITAVGPDGDCITAEGIIEGRIAEAPAGRNGFGYDPIFYVPEFGCTTAEMSEEQKNRISHRGRALQEMRRLLSERNV